MATKVDITQDGAKLYATVTIPPGKVIANTDVQRRATGAVTAWVKAHPGTTATRRMHGDSPAHLDMSFHDGRRHVTFFYRIRKV